MGALSWTLFYPEVLVAADTATYPRIVDAARLLAAGQRSQAEALLAQAPATGEEAGLAAALRTTIAVAGGDAQRATTEAARAVELAPDAASPRLAQSYARQLALDLDGAVADAAAAAALAPQAALPQARLAELYLMQGDVRRARRAADEAARLGPTPLTDTVQGFADLAALRGAQAEAAFRRALRQESQNPLALLGLGLAQIKQGTSEPARGQIEAAVAPTREQLAALLSGRGLLSRRRAIRPGRSSWRSPRTSTPTIRRRGISMPSGCSWTIGRSRPSAALSARSNSTKTGRPFARRCCCSRTRQPVAPVWAGSTRILASSRRARSQRPGRWRSIRAAPAHIASCPISITGCHGSRSPAPASCWSPSC